MRVTDMLERREEIPTSAFVGVLAEIYVEDHDRNIILRETAKFKTYAEAEVWYDLVEGLDVSWAERQKNRAEELKWVLGRYDTYERVELVECTADGKRYKLKKVYPGGEKPSTLGNISVLPKEDS
jgi:hypothetical protein